MANHKTNKIYNPERTKELQKDWQSYGATTAYYGLVVLFFVLVSVVSHVL